MTHFPEPYGTDLPVPTDLSDEQIASDAELKEALAVINDPGDATADDLAPLTDETTLDGDPVATVETVPQAPQRAEGLVGAPQITDGGYPLPDVADEDVERAPAAEQPADNRPQDL